MVQLSHPYMTTRKTISCIIWIFVSKVMFLLFNMLPRLVIAFLPRSKCILTSWLQSPSTVILETKKIKIELDHKEACVPKNRCFELWCWKRRLQSPLDSKEIKSVNPTGNLPWIFIGRTDAEAPILWPPDAKSRLIGKDPGAGKDWGQEEKGVTEDEVVGWHHQLNGHKFEQNSWSLLKLMPIELVMPSNHLILCCPVLLLPSIFPSTRVFSDELALHIRWKKYWSFSISPSNEYSGLIS